eukprot:TRINITY_DN3864_c0_g1_i2.p1 TRINITY_DN3864_c0_g1~~TRINITY_DN3864_c0_g1_i2.p1  ORF type:complete len:231 (-),score=41.57 TRINITY_DN3864_c0_g1_i2:242-934(-)
MCIRDRWYQRRVRGLLIAVEIEQMFLPSVKFLFSSFFSFFSELYFYFVGNSTAIARRRRKTLVLDLDETLIHSSIRATNRYDFSVEVFVNGVSAIFYVLKRPHLDLFLSKVSNWFEIVIFTASLKQYANPLIDRLDQNRVASHRLFRESCLNEEGHFIKNLGMLGMDLSSTIIIDNSPVAYSHNKENALPISHFYGDQSDEALLELIPFLEAIQFVNDVRSILSLRLRQG